MRIVCEGSVTPDIYHGRCHKCRRLFECDASETGRTPAGIRRVNCPQAGCVSAVDVEAGPAPINPPQGGSGTCPARLKKR